MNEDLKTGSSSPHPRNSDLYALVHAAATVGRERLLEAIEGGAIVHGHWHYPDLSQFESGIPNISTALGWGGPPDYKGAFAPKESQFSKAVIYGEIPEFRELIDYVVGDEHLRTFFEEYRKDEVRRSFTEIFAAGLATDSLDRYLHLHGIDQFEEDKFLAIYLEREMPLYEEKLPVEILVPIALTFFESEARTDLGGSVWLEKLDEPTQLARYPTESLWSNVHHCVLGGATHALVLGDFELPSEGPWTRGTSEVSFYPKAVIDRFFTAIRIEAGIDTGYAQIVLRPLGWAYDYTAALPPPIKGPTLRAYPAWFDQYGWLVKKQPVANSVLLEAGAVMQGLSSAGLQTDLASRRLSQAMLRTDETDAVIDVCIGLEALLGDESPTEMTHKLAMRVAAVHELGGLYDRSSTEVFRVIKRLYRYRSKLVHGRADAAKLRFVDTAETDLTLSAGITLLRTCVKALVTHEDYRDPAEIDRALLEGGLA